MALDLAARMKAELAGLFIEDVELLRAADSPSAREIAYPSASHAPLNRAIMERKLKAQSEQIRKILATEAHRAQVRWSFRTARGPVTSTLKDAVHEHDMVAMGRIGWSFGHRFRIGSTALELAISSIPMLLISHRAPLSNLRLMVYFDGSHASENALQVAAKLAHAGSRGITVLIGAAKYEKDLLLVRTLLERQALDVRLHRIELADKLHMLRVVREQPPALLVLQSSQFLKDRDAFEALLSEADLPLLLLGNGSGTNEVRTVLTA